MLTEALTRAVQAREPFDLELRVMGVTGERLIIRNICEPEVENGEVVWLRGTVQDITRQKAAEAERLELGARASAILESVSDGVVTIDEAGTIESVNPAAGHMFGYVPEQLVGQPVTTLMPEPYRSEHDSYIAHFLETGEARVIGMSRDVFGLHQDGTVFPLRLSVAEVQLAGRRLFTGVVHDRTHEVELEQKLLQSQRMESLGVMAGGIAHDFNNILLSIMGFTGIAQRAAQEENPELLTMGLAEIEKGTDRAASLVEQILNFSRDTKAKLVPISLRGEVAEVARFLQGSMPENVALHVVLPEAPCPVMGNTTQIHQVIQNLATNACHAMEPGGGDLTITLVDVDVAVSMPVRSGRVGVGRYGCLTVSDTGSGIAGPVLEQMFEPFYTTKEKGHGTGLGLATVLGIVTRMSGELDVETALGHGTSMVMYFPITDQLPEPDTAPLAPEEADALAGNLSGRVLVVDDETSVVKLLRLILEAMGLDVDGYTHPVEALEVFRADPSGYKLAIVDYNMPEVNGIDFAEQLHAICPGIPICLATGMVDQIAGRVGADSPICTVLKKPFRAGNLLVTIHDMLAAP
jgi:PAS domain S-box-containing protein